MYVAKTTLASVFQAFLAISDVTRKLDGFTLPYLKKGIVFSSSGEDPSDSESSS
jgi:hypothetical protein